MILRRHWIYFDSDVYETKRVFVKRCCWFFFLSHSSHQSETNWLVFSRVAIDLHTTRYLIPSLSLSLSRCSERKKCWELESVMNDKWNELILDRLPFDCHAKNFDLTMVVLMGFWFGSVFGPSNLIGIPLKCCKHKLVLRMWSFLLNHAINLRLLFFSLSLSSHLC